MNAKKGKAMKAVLRGSGRLMGLSGAGSIMYPSMIPKPPGELGM